MIYAASSLMEGLREMRAQCMEINSKICNIYYCCQLGTDELPSKSLERIEAEGSWQNTARDPSICITDKLMYQVDNPFMTGSQESAESHSLRMIIVLQDLLYPCGMDKT